MPEMNEIPDRNWRRLAWGGMLMLFGFVFLIDRMGLLPFPLVWYQLWPLLVIAMGLVRLVNPRRAKDLSQAVMFTLLGMWFLAVTNDWLGLTWHNSWPIAVLAVGASMVTRALAARWLPDVTWKVEGMEDEHHA